MATIGSMNPKGLCPNPYKTKFDTIEQAQAHIDKIKSFVLREPDTQAKRNTKNAIPQRAYFCKCGYWHITAVRRSQDTGRE